MSNLNYILISQSQAEALNGLQKGLNTFVAHLVKRGEHKGKFVVTEGTLEDFSEELKGTDSKTVKLSSEDFQTDLTPPVLTGLGVEIPALYLWVFEQDKFILNGFEIPLTAIQEKKYVDIAYFMWQEFRQELDTKNAEGEFVNKTLKRSLMPLWDYVAIEIQNNRLTKL